MGSPHPLLLFCFYACAYSYFPHQMLVLMSPKSDPRDRRRKPVQNEMETLPPGPPPPSEHPSHSAARDNGTRRLSGLLGTELVSQCSLYPKHNAWYTVSTCLLAGFVWSHPIRGRPFPPALPPLTLSIVSHRRGTPR